MKKILFTSLAVLGLGITGCSNEDLGVAKSGVDEVCATMGDAESRTAMNGNSVVWSIGGRDWHFCNEWKFFYLH